MTTKLKIDLTQGILEVEGSETFVKTIYRDFKVQFLGEDVVEESLEPPRRRRSRKTRTTTKAKAKPAKEEAVSKAAKAAEPLPEPKVPAGPTYTYIKELDLSGTPEHPALVDFMDSKLPITNEERNLVFAYYLQHVIEEKSITLDHIYSCYRKANIRAPHNLEHSLKMTADQQDWIKADEEGNFTVTAAGKRYVEKQLPKKMKS